MGNDDSNPRVWMILEDEEVLRDALSSMLRLWGITPLVIEDGNEAMAWLEQMASGEEGQPAPELALLDIRLPKGPQGHEFAHVLRKTPETADTTIVMITAYRFSPEEREVIEEIAQPDMVIHKPFPEIMELREKLESLLRKKKKESGP